MNITFTGIENICAYKQESNACPLINTKVYTISSYLTNDAKGRDKDNFYRSINKAGGEYDRHCIIKDFPDSLVMNVAEISYPGNKKIKKTEFFLNHFKIIPNNDKVLPLFSFMAQTMEKMKKQATDKNCKEVIDKSLKLLMKTMYKYMEVNI